MKPKGKVMNMGLKESDYEELGFTTIQSDRTMPSKY